MGTSRRTFARLKPRERDFLDELQRQRDEVVDAPSYGASTKGDDEIAALVSAPSRSVGEPAPAKRQATTYDADDLEIPSFLRRK